MPWTFRLAQEVFEFHAKGFAFDPKRSGAEWWVQIRDAWIETAHDCTDLRSTLLSFLVDVILVESFWHSKYTVTYVFWLVACLSWTF